MLSVIMPVKHNYDITKVCIDSLYSYTEEEFELIIVDDDSDREMKGYLNSLLSATIITNEESIGYPKSVNKALDIAKGEYIAIVNSDLVFTPDWFPKIVKHFESNSKIGLIGPTSNEVNNIQHRSANRPDISYQATDSLIFFCVVITRKCLEEVGGLDEDFSPGGMEDAYYCVKAKDLGFEVGIARDVFIYHYGSASFRQEFGFDATKSKEYAESRKKILRDKVVNRKIGINKGVPKVFIAIPTFKSGLVPGLIRNLFYWALDDKYEINIPPCIIEGYFPLDNARNTIVKEFLEQDYDYIWWVDDDIVPPVYALGRLLSHKKDIITAIAFSMREEGDEAFPYPVTLRYNEEKKYQAYYGRGVEEIDATGGAAVLVHRRVYESLERPYEFMYHKDGTLALTCDFRVWQKVQENGFKLYADYEILCDHRRTCSILGIQNTMAGIVNRDRNILLTILKSLIDPSILARYRDRIMNFLDSLPRVITSENEKTIHDFILSLTR